MKSLFIPDLYLDTIYDINLDRLKDDGINAVLLDIDNTLVTYDDPKPTESVLKWFDELKKRDISFAFISNNDENRVSLFADELDCFHSSNSKKPSSKYYKKAMDYLKTDSKSCAVIGDQIFTDVLSGRLVGCYTILVNPIKDKTSLFFKTKRLLEKPFIRKYKKLHMKRGA